MRISDFEPNEPSNVRVAVLKRNEGWMRRALCAALFFLVGFNPALGEVRITASTGGEVSHHLELFAVLRQSGERIVIDGPCYSA